MADGLLLLIVGITTVFLFLNIMILVMKLSSKLAHYISNNASPSLLKDTIQTKSYSIPLQSSLEKNNSILFAVISAAIHKYRNEHK